MKSNENKRIALLAGSFDPYTRGHHSLVLRALDIFDGVLIAVGHNSEKRTMFTLDERVSSIKALYANEPRVSVDTYDGLTVEYAQKVGACCLLRGVRSVKDFEYERDLADINRMVGNIETMIITTEPQYAALSSSVVRELLAYGKDVKALLPEGYVINVYK